MSRSLSKSAYSEAIIDGIRNAILIYQKITHSYTDFKDAPEYLLTVEIARSLGNIGAPVQLETSTTDTLYWGTDKGRGRYPSNINGSKRFDIVIFERTGLQLPRAVVEVKHPVGAWTGKMERDILRLFSLLKAAAAQKRRNPSAKVSIAHAFLAFYSTVSEPLRKYNSIDEKQGEKIARIMALAQRHNLQATPSIYPKPFPESEGRFGYPVVIHLSYNESNNKF